MVDQKGTMEIVQFLDYNETTKNIPKCWCSLFVNMYNIQLRRNSSIQDHLWSFLCNIGRKSLNSHTKQSMTNFQEKASCEKQVEFIKLQFQITCILKRTNIFICIMNITNNTMSWLKLLCGKIISMFPYILGM